MNKATILIVEDEKLVAENLSSRLANLGYEVAGVVADGEQAVALAGRLRPNLVLMDIWLKGPMDGIEAAETIRREYDTPVIYLTAHSDPATLARAKITDPFGYILKPFEERQLATQIELAIHKHQAEKAVQSVARFPDENPYPVIRIDRAGTVLYANRSSSVLGGEWRCEAGHPAPESFARLVCERLNDGEVGQVDVETGGRVFAFALSPITGSGYVNLYGRDVTEHKRAEEEREVAAEYLRLINTSANTRQLLEASVRFFHERSGCAAVGIRLRDGDDYPYYEAHGFPEEFLRLENSLCIRDPDGTIQRDHAGNPVMACMCGNVICGRFDPSKPFFTPAGSFWANDTTRLLATTSDADRQTPTRNRCNGEGYESVALLAIKSGEQCLGLLQLNDRRKGMFSPETIALWERLAGYLGVALAKTQAEDQLRQENRDIALANRIMEVFVKESGDDLFDKALKIVLDATESKHGVFGYIDERGHLMCPSMSKLLDECEVQGKCIDYPPEKWKGLWRRALAEKSVLLASAPSAAPAGHVAVRRNLAAPIHLHGNVIGLLNLANKETDYTKEDCRSIERITNRIAPVLYAWLQRDMREKERRQAESKLQALNASLEQRVAERTAEAQRLSAQLRALVVELSQIEQRERRRLAMALHENLQQLLVAAKLKLNDARRRASDAVLYALVQQAEQMLDDCIAESRSVTVQLSPPVLYDGGLLPALGWLKNQMWKEHDLTVQIEADRRAEPADQGIRTLVFQAVRELLSNVLQHAGVQTAQIEVTRSESNQVQIVVRDEGAGFDPAALEGRMADKGAFGLFGIRERLEVLGGKLDIQSLPGRGTSITLVAPLGTPPRRMLREIAARATEKAAPDDGIPVKTPHAEGRAVCVLVADDHPVLRKNLARHLREQPGIEVVGDACDGQEAVEIALATRPDVVLMDVTMPRMDGIEATRCILAQLPHVRVIGLSMHEGKDMIIAMREAGAVAFLTKSLPIEELVTEILTVRTKYTA